MPRTQGKGRSSELAVRPVRTVRPDNSVPHAICTETVWWLVEEEPTVNNFSIANRKREIFEFEGGVGAF